MTLTLKRGFCLFVFCTLLLTGCRREQKVVVQTPQPTPTEVSVEKEVADLRYQDFIYVSEFYKEGISEDYGRPYAVARAAKDGTLIGFDENAGADQVEEMVRALGGKAVGFSLYLEGPGGPTGENGEFGADELRRIVTRASKYCKSSIEDPKGQFFASGSLSARREDYEGYTTQDLDSLAWMKEWNSTGWKSYFKDECLPRLKGTNPYFHGVSFVAVEIDNLERHLEASNQSYYDFLVDFRSLVEVDGKLTQRLVLKNFNYYPERLEDTLKYAGKNGDGLFVGFHIAEVKNRSWDGAERLRTMNIETVYSTDTFDYLATNVAGLEALLRDRAALDAVVAEVRGESNSPRG